MPKSGVYKELADKTGLEAKQVGGRLRRAGRADQAASWARRAPGEFVVPNLLKFEAGQEAGHQGGEGPTRSSRAR